MATYNRDQQFDLLAQLIPLAKEIRQDEDKAETAYSNETALVQKLNEQINQMAWKMLPYGGATPDDQIFYTNLIKARDIEYAKLAPLRQALDNAHTTWDQTWQQVNSLVQNLLTNPGAVEKV